MAHDTKIGWTDSTTNPSSGCNGCELHSQGASGNSCYAAVLHEGRLALSLPALYASQFNEVRMIPGRLQKAASWADLTGVARPEKPWLDGKPRHIFVGDMGDFLSDEVTDEFLEKELLGAITSKGGRRHIWQLLTKRPERLARLSEKWGGLPDNVIAMTTVTNQRTAEIRIPALLRIRCKVLGVSAEPLLGRVNLRHIKTKDGILDGLSGRLIGEESSAEKPKVNWVICGGESGTNARPMHPEWAIILRDQCGAAGTAFFFKQWGHFGLNAPVQSGKAAPANAVVVANDGTQYDPVDLAYPDGARYAEACRAGHQAASLTRMFPVGKEVAGRLLKKATGGGNFVQIEYSEMPTMFWPSAR